MTSSNLAGLVAGVSLPQQTYSSLEDAQGTYFFNSNGQGNSSNNTIVDGVENTNFSLGLSLYVPNAEDVQEVHVSTNDYRAEYGRAGGAVVNAVTRGGTNQFHGTLWEFNRVRALAARDLFNKVPSPQPGLTQNLFGAAAGGPIQRDKTFFFLTYQGKYFRQATTSTSSLPQPAWTRGDFSGVPSLALYNPYTGNPNTGAGRQRYANNIIPSSNLSPIALKLNSYLSQPNLPGFVNNYVTNVPYRYNSGSYDARVDHTFSSNTQGYYVKFNNSNYSVFQGSGLGNLVGTSYQAYNYTVTATADVTHGFSPTLLTEVRVGYNRRVSISAREVCSSLIREPRSCRAALVSDRMAHLPTLSLPIWQVRRTNQAARKCYLHRQTGKPMWRRSWRILTQLHGN